ncbi:MAG: hypothetical protein K2O63_01105 [Alistipes sp.]|nr:hypothetical protein [Alistipes sp.]
MKHLAFRLLLPLLLAAAAATFAGNRSGRSLFRTSACFDLLASIQHCDKVLQHTEYFGRLADDSLFTACADEINERLRASTLCNFYHRFGGDKDNLHACVRFFESLPPADTTHAAWTQQIVELRPQLHYVLATLCENGFEDYWKTTVRPRLEEKIDNYPIAAETLEQIHRTINRLAGPQALPEELSKIYVLDIDNAFSLADESFCCTYRIIDREMERKLRLNFLNIYIHENLHRLPLSEESIARLDELEKQDGFYRTQEAVARSHREGRNEAFIVAAEVYLSHALGLRDARNVYDEFREYVGGSLVLAPIVYVHLDSKASDQSFDDFITGLFVSGKIAAGRVREQYEQAMAELRRSATQPRQETAPCE